MITFISLNYVFLAITCMFGVFNRAYDANFFQTAGFGAVFIYATMRLKEVSISSWIYSAEPIAVLGMVLLSVGGWQKTNEYCKRRRRAADWLDKME